MSRRLSCSFFAFIILVCGTYAAPLPQDTDAHLSPTSAGYLALGLCLPFVLLAILKYTYLKCRRAQTIHGSTRSISPEQGGLSPSIAINEKKSSVVGLGLATSSVFPLSPGVTSEHPAEPRQWSLLNHRAFAKVFKRTISLKVELRGYLVGFLGSPAWETRIKIRRGNATRNGSAECLTYVFGLCLL